MARKIATLGGTTGKAMVYTDMHAVPQVPEGVTLDSEEERILWRQYTQGRPVNAWRPTDLVVCAKIVKLEVEIRKAELQMSSESYLHHDHNGKVIPHPLLSVISMLQNRQLALIRASGLMTGVADVRTMNKIGQHMNDARVKMQKQDDSLIPRLDGDE